MLFCLASLSPLETVGYINLLAIYIITQVCIGDTVPKCHGTVVGGQRRGKFYYPNVYILTLHSSKELSSQSHIYVYATSS